ncbi:hypothetical protein QBC34DRAFT_496554 [Podospora aff. communis PSN243]|uniref:RING-type domain-containing protein n=1 Tax=Podospora aff. communis PSN243 TaxID=3040156 RepID=A0AAV9GEU8_9PEZI|nr:hypothetical protein QBC34DRAFT_496554 [Podospora aff. communis PSN243]
MNPEPRAPWLSAASAKSTSFDILGIPESCPQDIDLHFVPKPSARDMSYPAELPSVIGSILPCGHMFCAKCCAELYTSLNRNPKMKRECPVCSFQLKYWNCSCFIMPQGILSHKYWDTIRPQPKDHMAYARLRAEGLPNTDIPGSAPFQKQYMRDAKGNLSALTYCPGVRKAMTRALLNEIVSTITTSTSDVVLGAFNGPPDAELIRRILHKKRRQPCDLDGRLQGMVPEEVFKFEPILKRAFANENRVGVVGFSFILYTGKGRLEADKLRYCLRIVIQPGKPLVLFKAAVPKSQAEGKPDSYKAKAEASGKVKVD